jgi:hypothetical protein
MKEHIVRLKDGARQSLQELVQFGTRSVRVVRRALILLKSDVGFTDEGIAEHVGCSDRTVRSVRKRFCTEGWTEHCTTHRDLVRRRRLRRDSSSKWWLWLVLMDIQSQRRPPSFPELYRQKLVG